VQPRPNLENVLGKADVMWAGTSDADFRDPVNTVAGRPQPEQPTGARSPYLDLAQGATPFFLLGPPEQPARADFSRQVPPETPWLRSARLQDVSLGAQLPAQGVSVLLRRLSNPHLPLSTQPRGRPVMAFDGIEPRVLRYEPNPWYNPYLTVDYLDNIP